MTDTVEVTIPVDAEAAQALKSPARRAAAGRYISGLLKGGRARDLLQRLLQSPRGDSRTWSP